MTRMTLATIIAASTACTATAQITEFFADINSDNSVPTTPSPAVGTLSGEYDASLNQFSFEWLISDNLIGTPSAPGAHLHLGEFGQTGPVIFAFNDPDGSWALSGSAVWMDLASDQVDALFNEGIYVNFHTTSFPPGEVRGQLRQIPAPSTLAAAALGIAGLSTRRRR